MERTRIKTSIDERGFVSVSEIPQPKKWTCCRSCSAGPLTFVLTLGDQYVVGFVKEIDLSLPRAPLNLMRCDACGLLQLEHSVDPAIFHHEYWYRSSVNDSMRAALSDVIKTGLHYHHAGRWLDIGANDGYLLSQVPPGFTRIACEPSENFTAELEAIADHVIPTYFSAKHDILYAANGTREGGCDVITSCAMFYDLDDPNQFIQDIGKALSPNGVWINQLSDSPTMLATNAFDSICHEHVAYYDVASLDALYRRNGLVIIGVTYNDVNGGSIRVVAEKAVARTRAILLSDHPRATAQSSEAFALRTAKWKERMGDLASGPLARERSWLYGASTKGCALLQYLGDASCFTGIADRNPRKFGLKMAGTWLPIRDEGEMRADRPRYLMVLPWGFRKEFIERERPLREDGTTMIFPLPSIEFVL